MSMHNQQQVVCIVANTSWYVWNFRRKLIEELAENNFDIYVIAGRDEYFARLEMLSCKVLSLSIAPRSTNLLTELRTILSLFTSLRKVDPDIILSFTPKCNIYSSLLLSFTKKIAFIPNISGLGSMRSGHFLLHNLLTKLCYSFVLRQASKVFFQNADDRDLLLGTGQSKMVDYEILPGSGVDLSAFQYSDKSSRSFIITFVGRLIYEKGIEIFFELERKTRNELPNLHFQIFGQAASTKKIGITEEMMNDTVARASGRLSYRGIVDNMSEQLQGSAAVVLPSRYGEGVPRSLLEAASCGIPVITLDNVGCRDAVIHGKTGYLVDDFCARQFLEALTDLMNKSYEERLNMSKEARKFVELRFDEKKVLGVYLQSVSGIVG